MIPTDSVLGPGKIRSLWTADKYLWHVNEVAEGGGTSTLSSVRSIEAYREDDGSLWFRIFNEADGERWISRVNGRYVVSVNYVRAPAGEAD